VWKENQIQLANNIKLKIKMLQSSECFLLTGIRRHNNNPKILRNDNQNFTSSVLNKILSKTATNRLTALSII
jgi:hypothetical protein